MLSDLGPGWSRALAPAKLNPWLEVLGRRADGYHELETVMVTLDLADGVAARACASGTVELRLVGPAASADVPADARNLAWRGASIALELARGAGAAGGDLGLELVLDKRIPSQSGLGGASSDAAAALLAAAVALGLDLGPPGAPSSLGRRAWAALGALGSDCAFFVEAPTGAALCTGRGERVAPLGAPEPPWSVALIVPSVVCPTAAVYAALASLPPAVRLQLPTFEGGGLPGPCDLAGRPFFNRLEAAALRAVPELGPWRELLDGVAPGAFHLSGSGSSFFAVRAGADTAGALLERARTSAERRGLAVRGAWVARTAGTGARPVAPS